MASPTCVLLGVESSIDVLPAGTSPYDALEQGPFHAVHLAGGWTLHWSSSSYQLTEVNEVATSLAKETVKGDACLVHQSGGQEHLDTLLCSRSWKLAQSLCQPGGPRASSNINEQANCYACDSQPAKDDSSNIPVDTCRSCSSSGHALLKRARSLQYITAANSTQQRILKSVAAAAAVEEGPCSKTPPQLVHARPRPSRAGTHGLPLAHTGKHQATGYVHSTGSNSSTAGVPEQQLYTVCIQQQVEQQQRMDSYDTMACLITSEHSPPGTSCVAAEATGVLAVAAEAACSSSSSSRMYNGSAAAVGVPVCSVAAGPSGLLQHVTSNEEQHCWLPKQPQLHRAAGIQLQQMDYDVAMQKCDQQDGCDAEMPDAYATDAVPQCTVSGSTGCSPTWDELSDDVIGRIAGFAGPTVSSVMPIYLTCRSWRRALLEDDQLLLALAFKLNVARPFKPTSAHSWHAVSRQLHPALLLRASKLGNVSALVVRARLLDAAGCPVEAMRCWRRAAKFGHVEGQLVYGLGLYRGIAGCAQDGEEAHLWLLKALKQVLKADSAASASSSSSSSSPEGTLNRSAAEAFMADSSDTGRAAITARRYAAAAASTKAAVESSCSTSAVSSSLCLTDGAALADRVLAQAGLVLGYLAFDGEGTIQVDRQEAVKYFRMAAGAGCKEAEQVLGWIYSTGQYG